MLDALLAEARLGWGLDAGHGLAVVEDAAEAHGATVHGRRTGSLGCIGAFSFYANKIVTTGEGGMLTTDDGDLAARCRLLREIEDREFPPRRVHRQAA